MISLKPMQHERVNVQVLLTVFSQLFIFHGLRCYSAKFETQSFHCIVVIIIFSNVSGYKKGTLEKS